MRLHFYKGPIIALSLLTSPAGMAAPEATPDSAIERANQALSTIQATKPLKTEDFSFQIDEHVSGELTRKTYEGGLQRIMLRSYEPDSHGGGWTDLYYRNGNLIYAKEYSDYWQFAWTPEGEQYVVDTRSESTMVFDSGSCVQQLSKSAKSTTGDASLEELMEAATEEPMECGEAAIQLAARQ